MKKVFVVLLCLIILSIAVVPTFAATKSVKGASTSVYVAPTYLKARNSVRVTFSNVKNAKKISYTLMYEGSGVGQGVVGSFVPGKSNVISRDLFLGTCSGKVCRRHTNIKNIQLQVTTTTKGGASTKTYNIKS